MCKRQRVSNRPLRIQWVRYGRPAAEALRATIAAAKGDEPLATVTVIVPSNHVGVAARRLLASGVLGPVCGRGVGLAAATFVTPYRLAELLGAPRLAATGRRPVSTPVIAAALRGALAERPGLFAPVAAHPATETALVAAYRELRDISGGALDDLAAASERAAEVVRLCRATHSRLEAAWYDEQDLTGAAADALRAGNRTDLGTVIVYLPQRLSLHSARLVATVGETDEVTVLAGTTDDPRADAEVVTSLERLGGTPEPNPILDPTAVVAIGRTRILTASDADDEVRAAVRAVVDATRTGVPLDRIAILHASPQPYARLVHEQLSAAGIPANGAAVVPLTARVAGRALVDLLSLPAGGFRRQEVFAWLAAAPLRHAGKRAPVTAWERLSREAGVVAGRDHWDGLLARLAGEFDEKAVQAERDPDAAAWHIASNREKAERARSLRTFVLGLIDDLADADARPVPWGERARWAHELLDQLLGGANRRDRWPIPERKAAERVELALDRLGALDAVEGPVGLDVFTRTLELELEADLGRVGRFGEGVLVGSVAMGVGLDLDLVIVLGLAEGSFPAAVHDDSLLPDHDRRATDGQLPLRSQRVDREHRELLAALAGSSKHLLCVPRGDLRRSSESVPSRWVVQLADALGDHDTVSMPWLEEVASFNAGLRHLSFPATDQEYRLRSLLSAAPSRPGPATLATLADLTLTNGAAVASARAGDTFTRFDGNLAGLTVPSPADHPTSATRLEKWAVCPLAYLLGEVLGVDEIENPEDELRITPIDRGSLVHEALERFMAEVLVRPPSGQPAPDRPWSDTDRAGMDVIGEQVCDEYQARGLTGRTIFWRGDRERILFDLRRFLNADSVDRRTFTTRPVAAELAFGLRGSVLGVVPLNMPDGRTVSFRGKADRVDVADDGTLHVVDYKTGKPDTFKDLSQDNPDLKGRKLQLVVYGAAARAHQGTPDAPVRSEYWFVSAKGDFIRIGYLVTDDVLERVGRTLQTMVTGIEAGIFPNHPTATSTSRFGCPYCDPDGLGVVELRRQWERKRLEPALAVFANLAEPLAAVELHAAEVPDV